MKRVTLRFSDQDYQELMKIHETGGRDSISETVRAAVRHRSDNEEILRRLDEIEISQKGQLDLVEQALIKLIESVEGRSEG